jgi:hypothetical protein
MDASDPAGDSVSGQGSGPRRFQLPNIAQAAAEFLSLERRVSSGPISLLVVLAGAVVMGAFALFFEFGGLVFAAGLASLAVGFGMRRTLGCLGLVLFWPGVGAAVAGGMLLLGLEAAPAYWVAAGFFFVWGVLGARYAVKGSPARFLGARVEAARAGCHIGMFRPFNSANSNEAKNVLLPLLRGYGTVYVVSDDSFDRTRSDGAWTRDYARFPQHAPAHRYTEVDWQVRVQAEIEKLDVAVVDVSVPSASLAWEIKQCVERLPSHRIIFVASTSALAPHDDLRPLEERHVEAFMAQAEPIKKRLQELGVDFHGTNPRCLVYPPDAAGHTWLANALFQAMTDIVAIETGWLDEVRQIIQRSPSPIRDFYAANLKQKRLLITRGDGASQLTTRTRLELTDVLAELERKRSYTPNRFIVTVSVPICRACWKGSHSDQVDAWREADVQAQGWPDHLVRCGFSPAAVGVIQEQLAAGALYVFCHGPCHRALTYGRDDVYVEVLPFAEYCVELMRGIDESGREQGERWMKHLIFTASGGRCSLCRARLRSDESSAAKVDQGLSPSLVCRNCEERGALTAQRLEKVTIHHPLTPTSTLSW